MQNNLAWKRRHNAVPARALVTDRDASNGQTAVMRELSLILAGFLLVALAAQWVAFALGAG